MTKSEVIELMKSSKNSNEWNDNCDKVKAACGDYPSYWYTTFIVSGLMNEILNNPNADRINIVTF